MEEYRLIVKEDKVIIQECECIKDEWFIEIIGEQIAFYEIPQFGGIPIKSGYFETIIEALKYSKTLS